MRDRKDSFYWRRPSFARRFPPTPPPPPNPPPTPPPPPPQPNPPNGNLYTLVEPRPIRQVSIFLFFALIRMILHQFLLPPDSESGSPVPQRHGRSSPVSSPFLTTSRSFCLGSLPPGSAAHVDQPAPVDSLLFACPRGNRGNSAAFSVLFPFCAQSVLFLSPLVDVKR